MLFLVSSVSDDLLFSSCRFLVLLLALSFSRLILSLSFLHSSVSEALFALSFSFLSERCFFFVHAKSRTAQCGARFARPKKGKHLELWQVIERLSDNVFKL